MFPFMLHTYIVWLLLLLLLLLLTMIGIHWFVISVVRPYSKDIISIELVHILQITC